MSKPPRNISINHPIILQTMFPEVERKSLLSVANLCDMAQVRLRVHGDSAVRSRVWISGTQPTARIWDRAGQEIAVLSRDDVLVDQWESFIYWSDNHDLRALRALELLAYGFFDYDARECLCFQDIFDRNRCLLAPWDRPKSPPSQL